MAVATTKTKAKAKPKRTPVDGPPLMPPSATTPYDAIRLILQGRTADDVVALMPELIDSHRWYSAACGAMTAALHFRSDDVSERLGSFLNHLSCWPESREVNGKWV